MGGPPHSKRRHPPLAREWGVWGVSAQLMVYATRGIIILIHISDLSLRCRPCILNFSVFRGDCGHSPEGASQVCPVAGFSQGAKGNKNEHTLCGIRSVMMFFFVFFLKFRLPIGIHRAAVPVQWPVNNFQKASTKYHDIPDATQCTEEGGSSFARF